ncbi:MAG: N-acetylneuraminate synthase [Flavobacteriales bacterium]
MSLFDTITKSKRTFIIAEAGVNHDGNIELARKLVDIAVGAGVDAVKFQAFRTEHLILDNIEKAPYQVKNTGGQQTQAEMLRALELKNEQYAELKAYCQSKKILFLITPFDEHSLQELEELGVDAYKVASTDTTNLPFLKKIAQTGKPVILSTGMCYMDEVRAAVQTVLEVNKQLILLQCTANYPITDDEANLNVMHTFKKEFNCPVGYSDHTVGLGASLYAVAMGACVVEKHFTIDKTAPGPDHRASLDAEELKTFVMEIRKIEMYLGGYEKQPTKAEMGTRASLQKCLVATCSIKKGEVISEHMIVAKRTGGKGISPLHYKKLTGSKALRDYEKNDIIEME